MIWSYSVITVLLFSGRIGRYSALRASSSSSISIALPSLSVISWNINGFRSLLKHDTDLAVLKRLIKSKQPDFIWYVHHICYGDLLPFNCTNSLRYQLDKRVLCITQACKRPSCRKCTQRASRCDCRN